MEHHADFNVNAMSFTPKELALSIKKKLPEFEMTYRIDSLRQAIADSWPDKLDDSVASKEWGWSPKYNLDSMVDDMLCNLATKLGT